MTERDFWKNDNLRKHELNTKTNKNVYVKNYVTSTAKRRKRKIDGFRKRLMIPKSEFPECPEHEIKSKIGNILENKKYTWRVFC